VVRAQPRLPALLLLSHPQYPRPHLPPQVGLEVGLEVGLVVGEVVGEVVGLVVGEVVGLSLTTSPPTLIFGIWGC
jgi:hypothetical protein